MYKNVEIINTTLGVLLKKPVCIQVNDATVAPLSPLAFKLGS